MAKILCRTKGNAIPKGKPRVYFTCHPEDFDRYFDRICEDIFKTHDCAVFYTEDMTSVIEEQNKATDLESNNLFLIPVTIRLLSQPNRAMDIDIPFAFKKHIPVLPFMMEPGIDEFYAKKFGELQYLNPYSMDLAEISYEEKLKKYLESVLISDRMEARIRQAFDCYIFLSYRKKDRHYANELMSLIHSHPKCRDIAIWFDEFLVPGESYKANIKKALQNSKLFTLLVTPNLLEEPDGKPNYVMGEEYPAARDLCMDVLAAEMEKTDKATLAEKYPGIPDCVDPREEVFKARLLESISKIANTANDDDPMHNFLIGLAYLEGIDVEIDRQRGLKLITYAAEADLPEAMEKLYRMYSDGLNVKLDYQKAVSWAEKIVEYYQNHHGREHRLTMYWINNLAVSYIDSGNYRKATELLEEAYTFTCNLLGECHRETLVVQSNLASSYSGIGESKKALEIEEKVYALRCKVLGEEHPDTLTVLNNLAVSYSKLDDFEKAFELHEKACTLRCRILGKEHPHTLLSLNNLVAVCKELINLQNAAEPAKKVYTMHCKLLGAGHPDTIDSFYAVVAEYIKSGNQAQVDELYKEMYAHLVAYQGPQHPKAAELMRFLAIVI